MNSSPGIDKNRELPEVQIAKDILDCMPQDTILGREVHQRFSTLAPDHAFETVGQLTENGTSTDDLYGALHIISSMDGIQYFSVTHKDKRVLFKKAHAIIGPKSSDKAPDPIPSSDGNGIAYALVDDAWFGSTPYRMEYRSINDEILILVTNLQPLRIFIFPIIDSESLLIALLIRPVAESDNDDSRDVYGVVAARAPKIPFLQAQIEDSLRNRLAAMENWVRDRSATVSSLRKGMESKAGTGVAQN